MQLASEQTPLLSHVPFSLFWLEIAQAVPVLNEGPGGGTPLLPGWSVEPCGTLPPRHLPPQSRSGRAELSHSPFALPLALIFLFFHSSPYFSDLPLFLLSCLLPRYGKSNEQGGIVQGHLVSH